MIQKLKELGEAIEHFIRFLVGKPTEESEEVTSRRARMIRWLKMQKRAEELKKTDTDT